MVIVKAAPQIGRRHGETICCACVDLHGNWLRLYPVAFRSLEEGQRFSRWDRITFKWRVPKNDPRPESRRVDQQSIAIVGSLKERERQRFLSRLIVTSVDRERDAGKSLVLLDAKIEEFKFEKKNETELDAERKKFRRFHAQLNLFIARNLLPYHPSPYRFKYKYRTIEGRREGACQDWELEATFHKWSRAYGENEALKKMCKVFGEEYPQKGMLLAMGTHSRYPDTWLINGVIRLDRISQLTLI